MDSGIVDTQLWFGNDVFQGLSLYLQRPTSGLLVSSVTGKSCQLERFTKSHSPRKGATAVLAFPQVPWGKIASLAQHAVVSLTPSGCQWLWAFCCRLAGFPEWCRGFLVRKIFDWWHVCTFFGNVLSCELLKPERPQLLPCLSAWQAFSVVFCLVFNNTVNWNGVALGSRVQIHIFFAQLDCSHYKSK